MAGCPLRYHRQTKPRNNNLAFSENKNQKARWYCLCVVDTSASADLVFFFRQERKKENPEDPVTLV